MIGMGGGAKYSIQKKSKDRKGRKSNVFKCDHAGRGGRSGILRFRDFFASQVVSLLGADEKIDQMAISYLQTVLNFAPAFLLNNVLLCFVRNDGAPQLSMAAMTGGSLANIVLDYVFYSPAVWACLARHWLPVWLLLSA